MSIVISCNSYNILLTALIKLRKKCTPFHCFRFVNRKTSAHTKQLFFEFFYDGFLCIFFSVCFVRRFRFVNTWYYFLIKFITFWINGGIQLWILMECRLCLAKYWFSFNWMMVRVSEYVVKCLEKGIQRFINWVMFPVS